MIIRIRDRDIDMPALSDGMVAQVGVPDAVRKIIRLLIFIC